MASKEGLNKAGDVLIEQLKLITSRDQVINLTEFLVELNLFEDMFKNYLYGSMEITDSRNLIDTFNIHGEEFLNIKFRTPTFPDRECIQKTFRVFKLTDREIVRGRANGDIQNYTLHFVSIEVFYDVLLPLFIPFEGKITDVVSDIFSTYIAASRNFNISEGEDKVTEVSRDTELIIIDEPANKVKFVAPGWSPFKCINWLATKSISSSATAKNYIFFESNKNFYFGTIESIFKDAVQSNNYIGRYYVAASNVNAKDTIKDINREMFIASDVTMMESTDYIKNYTNGYLANRLIFLDIFNKEYKQVDYDHVSEYKKQFHTSGAGATSLPTFSADTFRNAATSISFYPKNPKLFTDFPDNINEKMDTIYGNRLSSLLELTNIKMEITVPGRTDVEVGRLLYFDYPPIKPRDETDKSTNDSDKLYSGYYMITAIHHKVNKNEHTMTMEIVKDSLYVDPDSNAR